MKIHRVKNGESLYSIAKEYGLPPTKIIEANDLKNPDELSVGEELLILTPTRTHTVRGGDTIKSIALRFGVNERELLAKNPALRGGRDIYPGQILTIKSDTPPYGMAFANGYYYNDAAFDRLICALPYLTYVTVSASKVCKDDVKLLFDDTKVVQAIREAGKSPLLHLFCESCEGRLESCIVDTAILLAKARGYDGINLSMNNVRDYKALSDFVAELKKTLMEYDLLLFVELDKNSSAALDDYYDGVILSYSKSQLANPPSFEDGERRIFTEFADEYESSKAYIELSPFAFADKDVMPIETAIKLSHTAKCEIEYEPNTKLCHFEYNKYSMGKRIPKSVYFESLENVKAKLDLVSELGYMGVSFDIMRTPLCHLMMFDAMFRQGVCISRLY